MNKQFGIMDASDMLKDMVYAFSQMYHIHESGDLWQKMCGIIKDKLDSMPINIAWPTRTDMMVAIAPTMATIAETAKNRS